MVSAAGARPRPGGGRKSVKRSSNSCSWAALRTRLPASCRAGSSSGSRWPARLSSSPTCCCSTSPYPRWTSSLRADLQWELARCTAASGSTFINVTHDQEEALSMSDDIVILREGRVEQTGSPELLYARPATQFVASFLGESNFIRGEVSGIESDRFRYTVRDRSSCRRVRRRPNPPTARCCWRCGRKRSASRTNRRTARTRSRARSPTSSISDRPSTFRSSPSCSAASWSRRRPANPDSIHRQRAGVVGLEPGRAVVVAAS